MPNFTGKGKENLGQYSLPREQYIENCRKGAIVMHERRKRKLAMQELAEKVLLLDLPEEDMKKALAELGFDEEATVAAGILFAQSQKAIHGDTDAARFVRDTAGQRPADNLKIGNLDDKPFEMLNLNELSDEDLRKLVAAKEQLEE